MKRNTKLPVPVRNVAGQTDVLARQMVEYLTGVKTVKFRAQSIILRRLTRRTYHPTNGTVTEYAIETQIRELKGRGERPREKMVRDGIRMCRACHGSGVEGDETIPGSDY